MATSLTDLVGPNGLRQTPRPPSGGRTRPSACHAYDLFPRLSRAHFVSPRRVPRSESMNQEQSMAVIKTNHQETQTIEGSEQEPPSR